MLICRAIFAVIVMVLLAVLLLDSDVKISKFGFRSDDLRFSLFYPNGLAVIGEPYTNAKD